MNTENNRSNTPTLAQADSSRTTLAQAKLNGRKRNIRTKNEKGLDPTNFGHRVAYLRKRHKWTQEKLAELADMEPPEISRIESGGRIPRLEKIVRLADALEVTVDCLARDWKDFNIDLSKN